MNVIQVAISWFIEKYQLRNVFVSIHICNNQKEPVCIAWVPYQEEEGDNDHRGGEHLGPLPAVGVFLIQPKHKACQDTCKNGCKESGASL